MIYFDLDGVLADFDKGIGQILGTDNIYKYEFVYGAQQFWDEINRHPNVFENFDMMPGAMGLWKATEHLKPTILTALPKSRRDYVDFQKRNWIAKHLGPHVPVTTCMSHDKPLYCSPGDVLIDDRNLNCAEWTRRGGIFILHKDVASTLRALKDHNIISRKNTDGETDSQAA